MYVLSIHANLIVKEKMKNKIFNTCFGYIRSLIDKVKLRIDTICYHRKQNIHWTNRIHVPIKEYWHNCKIRYRAWRVYYMVDKTMGDKLRTLAAKIDAVEEYKEKYCNPDVIGRMESYKCKRNYNKLKNNIKKELLLLLYNY